MKRIMSLIAVALLLVVLLTACSEPKEDEPSESQEVSVSQAESSDSAELSELTYADVEWTVEPTFEYEWIYYCGGCGFSNEVGLLDEKTGQLGRELDHGHGAWQGYFYYDEKKSIVGYSYSAAGASGYNAYPIEEFATRFADHADDLILLTGYDSIKVKTSDDEENEGFVHHNLEETLTGKHAIALGGNILTTFEFEDGEELSQRKFNNIIAVKKNGKWGIIGKDGKVAAPFVFEDAISIDDTTAFAKYDGKWGIIKVK